MKILVTGGAGFIGSNFILNYLSNNIILNYDKLTYAGNLNNLISIQSNINYSFVNGDIKNEKSVNKAIEAFKPDAIINFAAESHVDRSIKGPQDFIETNILGTFILLKSTLAYYQSLSNDKKEKFRFLHISTDEVYGSLDKTKKFKETTAYNPSSPYSASKASSDHLVKAWYYTYGLPILITNCSNNYGPYQFPEKLIPLIITNCLEHKSLPVYGKGDNIRDWIYVDDHCRGINEVLNKGKIGQTYNLGGNQERKNIDIVKSICLIMDKLLPSQKINSYISLISFVKDRPGHDFRYAIDSTKAESEIGFRPNETLQSGLKKTVDWYLNNIDWIKDTKAKKNIKKG
jgi:dTDP-glucose 4,6-dehydratase